MKSVLLAALLTRMTAAGGAGAGVETEMERREVGNTWEDVRNQLSALRSEVSTLDAEFQAARERHRIELERKQQDSEHQRRGR
jgi:DNA-binding FrmR family transcriptional regulator